MIMNDRSEVSAELLPQKESLGFLLADAMRLTRRVASKRFEAHQMTLAQAKALMGVWRQQGIRQVDLADQMEIQPITLARLLDQLSASGLIERRQDPNDRRAFQLFLTPAANPALQMISEASRLLQSQALAGLTGAEVATLFRALNKVRENLSASTR